MRARPTPIDAETLGMMPAADFADAFSVSLDTSELDAVQAAQAMFGRTPSWVRSLMLIRHLLVAPFGLKVSIDRQDQRRWIGQFPVVSETPERVVLGFDDKHLNFLVVVSVTFLSERARKVTATTLVQTHNALGRLYRRLVKPFHRRIVPAMVATTELK